MNTTPSLSIITTTDPLAGQLPHLLDALSLLATSQKDHYEVVIVDDLGLWETQPFLSQHERSSLTIKPIPSERQKGQLSAILTGFSFAQAPLLLIIDPDLHPCVPEIPSMMQLINSDTLVVHGVRSSRPDAGYIRLLGSTVINFLIRKVTGLNIYDIGSPITLFDRKALETITLTGSNQRNPRLEAYLKLRNKLAIYNVKGCTSKKTPSHYKLSQLLNLSRVLLSDAIHFKIKNTHRNG